MARRKKKTEIDEVEAIVQPDQELQDLTDIGLPVDGLQEVEVTEIESDIEAAETDDDKNLIEEDTCKTQGNSELPNEEKDSNEKSEKPKKDSEELEQEVSSKDSAQLSEAKTPKPKLRESGSTASAPVERSVKPSARKRSTSQVGNKKSQRNYKPTGVAPSQDEVQSHPKREKTVKPVIRKKDSTARSSVGVFYRP